MGDGFDVTMSAGSSIKDCVADTIRDVRGVTSVAVNFRCGAYYVATGINSRDAYRAVYAAEQRILSMLPGVNFDFWVRCSDSGF